MNNPIFQTMLSRYEIHTKDDYTNALHEVMQQTVLAGLFRNALSRRDNTLLTVCFSLRTKQTYINPSPAGTILSTIKL
jgi:hypothetical protein